VDDGYLYFADRKLVTINNKINHYKDSENVKGAIVVIDSEGTVSFKVKHNYFHFFGMEYF